MKTRPLAEMRNRIFFGWPVLGLWFFERSEAGRLLDRHGAIPPAKVVSIIPTFRRPESLRRAVNSALAQTISDHVVVVVDDAGHDLGELPTDPRLVVVTLSRNVKAPAIARNVAIRMTSSDFLAFLDDDNEWRPDHLQVSIGQLESGADMTYTNLERRLVTGELIDVLGHPFDRRRLRHEPYIDTNSIVVRREKGVRFSRIPRSRGLEPKEDWEFVYRYSRHRVVRHIDEPTVRYLINDRSYFSEWADEPPDLPTGSATEAEPAADGS
jgi:glycosyltransferase involved in cell wall biosynthesis